MALLKYLKKGTELPDPDGPLSTEMPSSSIQAANKVVKPVLEEMKAREAAATAKKRGQYKSYTASEKAMIAKRATECGVTNTVRYFSHKFVDRPLCEGTIRTWVKQYKRELIISRRECNKDANIEKLESKRRGRVLYC